MLFKSTAEFLLGRVVFGSQFDECWVKGECTEPPSQTQAPSEAKESQEERRPSWARVKDWEFAPEKRGMQDSECQA